MASRDIVAIGASAGGVEALTKLVGGLPADLPAAVFVVLHVTPQATSVLPTILNRSGPLHAVHPIDGDPIERGRIYVAPPDHHLLLKEGRVAVVRGPRENHHRPAIDPTFRTAAHVYGSRVVGVILSGSGDDGVVGLVAIKRRGGLAIAQDPMDALQPELPRSAIDLVNVDYCRPVSEIAGVLVGVVRQPAPAPRNAAKASVDDLKKEARIAEVDIATIEEDEKLGVPSAFSCPDCGGVLWELEGEDLLRFRCRVGHSYSARALVEEQAGWIDRALWAAFRAFEENASFARRLAVRARLAGHTTFAERYQDRADEATANARAIREMILRLNSAVSTSNLRGG